MISRHTVTLSPLSAQNPSSWSNMSPCCGSVQLLVLLGVLLASGSPVQYLSANLMERHRFISDKLVSSDHLW